MLIADARRSTSWAIFIPLSGVSCFFNSPQWTFAGSDCRRAQARRQGAIQTHDAWKSNKEWAFRIKIGTRHFIISIIYLKVSSWGASAVDSRVGLSEICQVISPLKQTAIRSSDNLIRQNIPTVRRYPQPPFQRRH